MVEQPVLTEAEWEIVYELLNHERRDLPAEIHHTLTRPIRDQLKERLRLIETLLRKLEPLAGSAASANAPT